MKSILAVHVTVLTWLLGSIACADESDGPDESTRELRRVELEVDGHRVVYEVGGEGEPAVVFVHGGISNRSGWSDIMDTLVSERRVLAVDLPGHGESEPRSSYDPRVFSDAVAAVIDDADLDEVVLVGHSFGVSVIRDVALADPSRVVGFYMMDGFLVPLGGGDPAVVEPLLDAFRSDGWQEAARAFVEIYMLGPSTPPEVADDVRAMMLAGTQDLWLAVLSIATSPAIERAEVLDVPTTGWFLPGPTFPTGYEVYLEARFPQLTLALATPGSGHFLMWERPEEFETSLRSLIAIAEEK